MTELMSKKEYDKTDITSTLAGIRIARISTVPFFVATQLKSLPNLKTLLKHSLSPWNLTS